MDVVTEEIKLSYQQEQMKKAAGEWYLEDLEATYNYMRTISAYININFKKSIKVDATSAMYNISGEKWIVYCRYCDKIKHCFLDAIN